MEQLIDSSADELLEHKHDEKKSHTLQLHTYFYSTHTESDTHKQRKAWMQKALKVSHHKHFSFFLFKMYAFRKLEQKESWGEILSQLFLAVNYSKLHLCSTCSKIFKMFMFIQLQPGHDGTRIWSTVFNSPFFTVSWKWRKKQPSSSKVEMLLKCTNISGQAHSLCPSTLSY